jgi:hypothetical protein
MKPALAHLSPTVPATFATAVAISLSVFLLAGSGVQGEPTPLLPAIGGAAGHVAAELPAVTYARPSAPARRAAPAPDLVAPGTQVVVSQRRSTVSNAQPVHRRARTRVVRRAAPPPVQAPAPVQVPASTPPTTAATTRSLSAKGKARGHGHSAKPAAGTGAHGHGKALGHPHGLPPGQAKKAPAAPLPAPAAPPKPHGAGNGHKGGKK